MRKAKTPLWKRIANSRSGNASILLAIGLPALIGGTGYAVDTAQWYLWKRELQHAVDQAAIAGAWAKAQQETGTLFSDRAAQEYSANIKLTASFDSGPTVTLEDYDGGTDNSIQVVASATKELPFSSLLTNAATTVRVRAQAIYEPGAVYKPCLLALDPSAAAAMHAKGDATIEADCGIGAISDDDSAIYIEGNSTSLDIGFAITSGGIDDVHGGLGTAGLIDGASDLQDPYDGLTPPDNSTPRSLSCPPANGKYTADETTTTTKTYSYYKGKNKNSLTSYTGYEYPKESSTTTHTTTGALFGSEPQNSTTTTTSYIEVSGGGNDKIWEKETVTTAKSYSNIVAPSSAGAQMLPGTYTNFNVQCDTTLAGGVYVIDGGLLKVEGGNTLTGTGVMFVLKNGAGIQIAGTADLNLTAMTRSELLAVGVSEEDVDRMLDMLIFEDPESPGATGNKLTGSSNAILNGIIYLPKSRLEIQGTPKGSSKCLVIASKTLLIGGTADLSTLCPTEDGPNAAVVEKKTVVRLVG